MRLFFGERISKNEALLTPEESHHAVRVLRLVDGDRIGVLTPDGTLLEGPLTKAGKRECSIQIEREQSEYGKVPYSLHIAMAPTKQMDRFEWFLEKATEIGVTRITPLFSEHSERRSVKMDRIEKVLAAAVKQSHKGKIPQLDTPMDLEDFMREQKDDHILIAHCNPGDKIPLKDSLKGRTTATILIGPEGDFSPEEVEMARERGAIPVSLGDFRLRTETAGIVAVHTASLFLDQIP